MTLREQYEMHGRRLIEAIECLPPTHRVAKVVLGSKVFEEIKHKKPMAGDSFELDLIASMAIGLSAASDMEIVALAGKVKAAGRSLRNEINDNVVSQLHCLNEDGSRSLSQEALEKIGMTSSEFRTTVVSSVMALKEIHAHELELRKAGLDVKDAISFIVSRMHQESSGGDTKDTLIGSRSPEAIRALIREMLDDEHGKNR